MQSEDSNIKLKVPEAFPLGLFLSAIGLGAVIGAFLVASLPGDAKRGRMLTLGNLCFPIFLLIFVNMKSLPAALLVIFLVGLSNVFQNSMANTLLQITVPDRLAAG